MGPAAAVAEVGATIGATVAPVAEVGAAAGQAAATSVEVAGGAVANAAEAGASAAATAAAEAETVASQGLADGAEAALATGGHDEALKVLSGGSTLTSEEAGVVMGEKLQGLPAFNRDADPRWREVFNQRPDYFANQPPPAAGNAAYQRWEQEAREINREGRSKADAALKSSDPAAYEAYRRYGIYRNDNGEPNPRMDPEARHLFEDGKLKATAEEIAAFRQEFPEKAAVYSDFLKPSEVQPEVSGAAGQAEGPDATAKDAKDTTGKKEVPVAEKTAPAEGQVSEADKKISILEGKIATLTESNEQLAALAAQVKDMAPMLKILLEDLQEREKDKKKKEPLKLMIARILAIIAMSTVVNVGPKVAAQPQSR